MISMGNHLRTGASKLEFIGLQGYKGNDILASIIVAESEELGTLDMSETRYTLVKTVIDQIKNDNKITAMNLSAVGGIMQKWEDWYTNLLTSYIRSH